MPSVRLLLAIFVLFAIACSSTPEPPPPPPPPPPVPVAPAPPPPDPTTFKTAVAFDASSAELDATGIADLDAFARKLSKFPKRRVHAVGYTDPSAGDGVDEWLSEQRAKRVAAYLVARGIPADRVSLEGRRDATPMGIGTATNQRVVEVTVR